MKSCQCCGVEANADVPTCANCGEASWMPTVDRIDPSRSVPVDMKIESESVDGSPLADPDTAVEVPRVRRGNRRPN